MNRKDYTGQRFGKLVIIEMLYNYQNKGSTYARCKCDCGNEKIILMSNIKKGLSKSCGCMEKESRHHRKHNKDLLGKKYGKLTVIKQLEINSNGHMQWLCRCDCGKERIVTTGLLTGQRIKSCGCDKYDSMKVDLSGKVFGMLTVVKPASYDTRKHRRTWECICECGKTTIVTGSDLVTGNTQSCGCIHKSHNEHYIENILKDEDILYEAQYRFENCKNIKPLPFDFYLPNYNVAIEYDGRQHYEPINFFGGDLDFQKRQNNDRIKNDFCKANNIQLIRIPYTSSKEDIHKIIISIKNPVTTKTI